MKKNLPFFLIFFLANTTILAQTIDSKFDPNDADQYHFLVTKNDDRMFGKVLSLINTELKFVFLTDTVSYQLADLVSIEVVDIEQNQADFLREKAKLENKKVRRRGKPHLARQRNFMSESAFRLKKNESELRNSMLLYASYDRGLSDHLSIGVQTIVPGLAGVRAKYSNDLNKFVHYGIGTGFYLGFFNGNVVNHSFGILTLGTPDYHLTFTGGHGWSLNGNTFNNFQESKSNTPVFTAAGSFRFAKCWRWMFEFGSISGDSNNEFQRFFTSTVSWFKYRSNLDFGIAGYTDLFGFTIAIPVAAFSYRFGGE